MCTGSQPSAPVNPAPYSLDQSHTAVTARATPVGGSPAPAPDPTTKPTAPARPRGLFEPDAGQRAFLMQDRR